MIYRFWSRGEQAVLVEAAKRLVERLVQHVEASGINLGLGDKVFVLVSVQRALSVLAGSALGRFESWEWIMPPSSGAGQGLR